MIKKVTTMIICCFITVQFISSYAYSTELKSFSDVKKRSWYEKPVYELVKKNVIDGFPDGTFRPDENIKVDEFIKLLIAASGYEVAGKDGYWAQKYIDIAYSEGIIFNNEIFDFKRNINRAEMCRMIIRAIGINDLSQYCEYQKNMNDISTLDARYREFAEAGYGLGIINGIDNKFIPYRVATRKEACMMIYRYIFEEKRVRNTKKGISEKYMTIKELCSLLRDNGYDVNEEGAQDEVLSREKMAMIIYTTILNNSDLTKSIIPVVEIIERPLISDNDSYTTSDTYSSICSYSKSIKHNFYALQIFDIYKSYDDGTGKKILNFNSFINKDIFDDLDTNFDGFKLISGSEVTRTFDHSRFLDIFKDSSQIKSEYKYAMCKLYDLGILDLHSFSEFALKLYCSPKAAVTEKELDDVIKRLKIRSERNVLDEKVFGIGDSWGEDLYGEELYTFRISETNMLYIYDTCICHDPLLTRIYPDKDGIMMSIYCMEWPYYDDQIIISDKCREGEFNFRDTATVKEFLLYDRYKYSNYVPYGYRDAFLQDMENFFSSSDQLEFNKTYGVFDFKIKKIKQYDQESVIFKYAFKEVT